MWNPPASTDLPETTGPSPDVRTNRHRSRARRLAVVVLIVLALLGALLARSSGSGNASAPDSTAGSVPSVDGAARGDPPASRPPTASTPASSASPVSTGAAATSPDGGVADGVGSSTNAGAGTDAVEGTSEPSDAQEDALDASDDSEGMPDGGGSPELDDDGVSEETADEPVELEPVDGAEAHPCDALGPDSGVLLVAPDPLVLASGAMQGTVTIRNCGPDQIDWTAATKPTVSLSSASGQLTAGEVADLGFTIDADAYDAGAITFKIKVSEPGHNHYVDVHAYEPVFGQDLVAGGGNLSAGAGAGGCANQCIVKALLSPNATTPNVGLEVGTNVPARIKVYVSQNPPVDDDGKPKFPGVAPTAVSPAGTTSWTTIVSPLEPAEKYYLIVTATDANDKTSYRSTSFTTTTPVGGPGGIANPGGPAGCSAQCITTAVLTPGDGFDVKHLHVQSHTPAIFQASVSTAAPIWDGSTPSFAQTDAWVNSGLQYKKSWDAQLTGLAEGTGYHIIVRAEDAQGRVSYRVGQFQTAADPGVSVVFTLHSIKVTHDGDKGINRGELSFAWMVGDTLVATKAEQKLSDGDVVTFSVWQSTFVADGVKGFLPTVFVRGSERDADGIQEFCSLGFGQKEMGFDDGCDAKWNVASSGIVSVDGIDDLAACSTFGLAGALATHRCMELVTVANGDDYPRFEAIVIVDIA